MVGLTVDGADGYWRFVLALTSNPDLISRRDGGGCDDHFGQNRMHRFDGIGLTAVGRLRPVGDREALAKTYLGQYVEFQSCRSSMSKAGPADNPKIVIGETQ
jgi:hypothetical protein